MEKINISNWEMSSFNTTILLEVEPNKYIERIGEEVFLWLQ